MGSLGSDRRTVLGIHLCARASLSEKNEVEVMNFMQMYFAIKITIGLIAALVVIGWVVMVYIIIKREGK
jgi:hypothetical protein